MSSQPKKKTLAQIWAEKQQRSKDIMKACDLAVEVWDSFSEYEFAEEKPEYSHDRTLKLLDEATPAQELIWRCHADTEASVAAYGTVALVKI